jgi:hypothetical protein
MSPGNDFCVHIFTGHRKKCIENGIAKDIIAIAHDDDLHSIEDMVSPSQNAGLFTQIQPEIHVPRKC